MKWLETKIDGRTTAFVDVDIGRLYITERSTSFETYVCGEKIGSYDTMKWAQYHALTNAGIPAPKPRPARTQKWNCSIYTAKPVPPPREMIYGEKGGKPPVREAEEAKLKLYPIADLSAPPKIAEEISAPILVTLPVAAVKIEGHCRCGAKFGRKGKCPALCEPVPEAEVVAYKGPRTVGSTHTARLGAPVSW